MSGDKIVAIVGLGYVGLPLAVEFGKKHQTIGYDLSSDKIREYKTKTDPTGEVLKEDFDLASQLSFSSEQSDLGKADIIIVAVPTPVDASQTPDLSPLISATETIGYNMKKGATVIFESTVYPGATEEVCVPALERTSGLKWKKDFYVGYSPERMNPGDKDRTVSSIIKVVSGDNDKTLKKVEELYGSIVDAGVYSVSSIKIAEAAKVIENTQRDLNIALMNELAIIFNLLDIDTAEVLKAAETKWNFVSFWPGLVGGHCIGVDPYYLTHKAEMIGYNPQVILAGRRINDQMPCFIAQQTIKQLIKSGKVIKGSIINVLGLTFKENCADTRNSKVLDLIQEFLDYDCAVNVHDPFADSDFVREEYGLNLKSWDDLPASDALVVAVAHDEYLIKPIEKLLEKLDQKGIFVDVKSAFQKNKIEKKNYKIWRL